MKKSSFHIRKKKRKKQQTTSTGCKSNLPYLAGILFCCYLILFFGTAYIHHMSPGELFKVTWNRQSKMSTSESSNLEREMQYKGSTIEGGSSLDDVAAALPLETPEDVRGIWTRVLDEKTNNFYYHNQQDNTVTWDAPSIWMDSTIATSSVSKAEAKAISETKAIKTPENAANTTTTLSFTNQNNNNNNNNSSSIDSNNNKVPLPQTATESVPSVPSVPSAPTTPPPSAIINQNQCGNDQGLGALKKAATKHFTKKSTSSQTSSKPLWLRVVMVSHGRHVGGPNELARPQEDMLRAVRTLMMDAATSGGSPFGNALGVVVANFAGPNNNPGYEAAKSEAMHDEDYGTAGTKFDFFDGSGFDILGSCGSSARRDFFGALEIGLSVGSCQHLLLMEAGESLCPSALLMLYYAMQKSNDYDPTWSTLRVGKGKHGYGGLVIRCDAARKLLQHPNELGGVISKEDIIHFNANGNDNENEKPKNEKDDENEHTFMKDMSTWMRKERIRTNVPLLHNRPIGGSFAYRYRLISENLLGEGCGSSIELNQNYNDLSFHSDSKCNDNDISPCAAAENDAWLEYKPPNIASVIGSHIMLVIGQPGENCNHACTKHTGTTCLSGKHVKYNLNDCATLRGRFPCPGGCVSLNQGAGSWPVPSQLVSNTNINGITVYKGTCIIRQNGIMSLCRASSP